MFQIDIETVAFYVLKNVLKMFQCHNKYCITAPKNHLVQKSVVSRLTNLELNH